MIACEIRTRVLLTVSQKSVQKSSFSWMRCRSKLVALLNTVQAHFFYEQNLYHWNSCVLFFFFFSFMVCYNTKIDCRHEIAHFHSRWVSGGWYMNDSMHVALCPLLHWWFPVILTVVKGLPDYCSAHETLAAPHQGYLQPVSAWRTAASLWPPPSPPLSPPVSLNGSHVSPGLEVNV